MMNLLNLLAWIPLINPIPLPPGWRLWMFLPLTACVALVYRGSRVRDAKELPRGAAITFANIVVGMVALAVLAYAAHLAVLYYARD